MLEKRLKEVFSDARVYFFLLLIIIDLTLSPVWDYSCIIQVAHRMSRKSITTLCWETPIVTKKEIVKAISEELGLTQLRTKEIVQKTFDAIIDTLISDQRIELRNFGVFEVKKRAARKARNPRTGDEVEVAEKYVVTFKPGKEMEERVKQMGSQPVEAEKKSTSSVPFTSSDAEKGGTNPPFKSQFVTGTSD